MKFDVVNSEQQWLQSERGEERWRSMVHIHPCLQAGMVIPCMQCCGAVAALFGSEPEPPLLIRTNADVFEFGDYYNLFNQYLKKNTVHTNFYPVPPEKVIRTGSMRPCYNKKNDTGHNGIGHT